MNLAELFKKNIILIPVVASILVGTFTSIRYVLNLTSTIDDSKLTIIKLESDLDIAKKEHIPKKYARSIFSIKIDLVAKLR